YVASSGKKDGKKQSLPEAALQWYLGRHVDRMFEAEGGAQPSLPTELPEPPLGPLVAQARRMVEKAERPVLLVGSQAVWRANEVASVAQAVEQLGMPLYLASMARGLLGPSHRLQLRHKRRNALKGADLVILAGVPADFRLEYGRAIAKKAKVISVNLALGQLFKNKLPSLPVPADPGRFLMQLAQAAPAQGDRWAGWLAELKANDAKRDAEIAEMAKAEAPPVNPLQVCLGIERAMSDDAVIVADGGDFVATAAYVTQARGPLKWLDPGVFGTLGVGGGFAAAAALCRPGSEVWLLYGDGAAGFSLIELDTFARHGLPVIAVIGNDAGWTQIARDQIEILKDDVGTVLARTAYHEVAKGYGAEGLLLDDPTKVDEVFAQAKAIAASGRPVLVNAHIGATEFRKGSISM
ncbi:MAG: thiamine pyrophosphate-binding protein, partial [Myxococcales bacterium]|nr:thiamine pyrophosphate-binding protein [Myxococcales bacterium]